MQDKIHYSRREASPSRLKYLFPLPPATLVFLSILILGVKESYKNIQSKSSVSGNVNFVFETNIFISHSNNSILSQNLRQGVEYQDRELDISESAKGSETMNDILQRYKDYLCGEYANKNTRKNKYSCVKNFLKFVDGVITKDNLLKWRQWANKHYKHNTLNISIQRINEFIEWYKKPELKKMKLIGFKDANKKALTENQFKALKQNEAVFKVSNTVILFKKIQIEENNMFLLFLIDSEKKKEKINEELSAFLKYTQDLLLRYIA